jgi:hypothetical protein
MRAGKLIIDPQRKIRATVAARLLIGAPGARVAGPGLGVELDEDGLKEFATRPWSTQRG